MLTISDKIMNKLINNLGEIIRWPKKPPEKEIIIKYLSTKFESDKKFDCITFWGVLEHVVNPVNQIKKAVSCNTNSRFWGVINTGCVGM